MATGGEETGAMAQAAALPARERSGSDQAPLEPAVVATATSLESRADPDAQTTVTDFLDFTEYLPSDMIRSLTLIGKLDQAYTDASVRVNDLTTAWGQLPGCGAHERPDPAKLRADISENLDQAVSSRVFAHAEAVRMSENVNRHYNKAKMLLAKLQNMMDNYPAEEPRSPVAAVKSPQLSRNKVTVRTTDEDGKKISRHRIPRITVPGEVLAPYDIEYDTCSDDSDISTDSESDIPAASRRTPAPASRIKIVTNKTPKSASRPARPQYTSAAMSAAAAANAAALLNPPPENAVIGSPDAPWLQLTQYELAKLRKRMKKNATWTPSDTMVARELKALGRGPDEYREAKKKAEEEGKVFNPAMPNPIIDDESGTRQLPAGALSADALAVEEHPTSNRGMKLNEAKKLKREALAKLAAEEAEESARKMAHAAKLFLGNGPQNASENSKETGKPRTSSRSNGKRKREGEADSAEPVEPVESSETPSRPVSKRTKTETPVPPPPRLGLSQGNAPAADGSANQQVTPGGSVVVTQLETPVPIPVPPRGSSVKSAASPSSVASNGNTVTTSVPTKPPALETPVPLPRTEQRTASREGNKRETRGEAAKRHQQQTPVAPQLPPLQITDQVTTRRSASRGHTPSATPAPESAGGRRPSSRGTAMSQEPPSLASERSRRASTARNTPVPELKQPPKRTKRPAPGVVSTTNSGGNSAVGKRKAAPKRKARLLKREKGQVTETEMEEVDDEGNPIDPNEPRYCLCNRVSFGTMIQCDNMDEWFHLECVGLSDIPARTTKWYCPDCRRLLNIGERGEVSARGVRK
ncbi:hypothetical protein HIM_08803 [Hirsutella minnesotensis 3608]|uniref:PHD-type domain-containing protein n=1 Tax=Hirsutella minnesotensis 3608 TaxID=1043627 RepID=A0A0F7ZSQ7_9HYPO|nr:hypothetical protein HIM_08803 [Hirsutella minnesotensis 3608]